MVIGFRSLGYKDDMEKKPSHVEMVTVQATAGMVAGACSSVITTPIDTVKTRLQVYKAYASWIFVVKEEKYFSPVWI
jgi:solute carrier family 25, member 44